MTSTEERMQILKMIQEGKITADEGAKLLEALNASAKTEKRPPAPPPPPGMPGSDSRWFRVRVTDLPITQESIFRALLAASGTPLAGE